MVKPEASSSKQVLPPPAVPPSAAAPPAKARPIFSVANRFQRNLNDTPTPFTPQPSSVPAKRPSPKQQQQQENYHQAPPSLTQFSPEEEAEDDDPPSDKNFDPLFGPVPTKTTRSSRKKPRLSDDSGFAEGELKGKRAERLDEGGEAIQIYEDEQDKENFGMEGVLTYDGPESEPVSKHRRRESGSGSSAEGPKVTQRGWMPREPIANHLDEVRLFIFRSESPSVRLTPKNELPFRFPSKRCEAI